MEQVGFDESGNTGEDLLNKQQPVYVLASVHVSDEDAASLLGTRSQELHFVREKNSQEGRRTLLNILSADVLSPDNVKVYVVHKRYMITAKLVDVLLEPVFHEDGIDLYIDGAAVAMANLLHAVWPAFSAEGFARLQESFVRALRQRTPEAAEEFYDSVEYLAHRTKCEPDFAFLALALSKSHFAEELAGLHSGKLSPELDPALTSLHALTHYWSRAIGEFEVVHDESKHVITWEQMLRKWWKPKDNPLELRTWHGEVLRFPLNVADLTFARSHESPLVQLADVVAGAVCAVANSLIGSTSNTRFAEELERLGVLQWVVQCIWPSLDIAPGALGVRPGASPSVADQMARWLARGEKEE